MMNIKEYLEFAKNCAIESGKIIRKGFFAPKRVSYKGFGNPVTEYDKASEKLIVSRIKKNFPDFSILTEEGLSVNKDSKNKWIIDPLDGTVNFAHCIPFVAVSIALEIEGEILLGVVYNPILNEIYYASKGKGAFFNGRKIKVSSVSEPSKALLVTGFPYERKGRIEYLLSPIREIYKKFTGFRRLGSAAVDMCYVARGSFEGFYEENLKPWDTAAGKIIVEEAGGRISDYSGNDYNIYMKTIVASNGIIHPHILQILKNIPEPE